MEEPKIIKPEEVMGLMRINLEGDREEFKKVIRHLKHGEKDRLLEAMISYPIVDMHFAGEADLENANIISKRISDTLVAIGLEHTLQGMIAEQTRQQQAQINPNQAEEFAEVLVEETKKRKSKKQEKENVE